MGATLSSKAPCVVTMDGSFDFSFPNAHSTQTTTSWSPTRGNSASEAIEHRFELGAVVALAWREHDQEGVALAIAGQVQLGRQPAPAPHARFVGRMRTAPLFRAPAAC
jgi:hypothetical protein